MIKRKSINNIYAVCKSGLGGRGLSIESRNFLRNICHFQSNLPFKSDFESHFTFKNLSLNSPEMAGGGCNLHFYTYAISFEKKLKVITQKVNIWQC